MRVFITLEFDKETKERIKEIQGIIRKNSQGGRFKYIDNFHLTLKFLGEIENSKIELIYNDLCNELKEIEPFWIYLNGIGGFGIGEFIRTLYIKTEGQINELICLANKIGVVTNNYGFKSQSAYSPHITIAQDVKLNIPFDELRNHLDYKFCDKIFFTRVIIMKSEQVGNKRIYSPLKTIKLNDKKM